MDKDLLNILKGKAKENHERNTRFHCYAHAIEVLENVQRLIESDNQYDYDVESLYTAALFHDISNYQDEREGIDGAEKTEIILKDVKTFPQDKITDVKRLIISIGEKAQNKDEILFSTADEMAAFSELGLIRSIMIAASKSMKVKDAIEWELSYLEKRYNSFRLEAAKKFVEKIYIQRKKLLQNCLDIYQR